MQHNIQAAFKDPLAELDRRLNSKGQVLRLVVVGAFALQLLNISGQYTADIDSVEPLTNVDILEEIASVGQKFNLGPEWINDTASSIDLPEGFLSRVKKMDLYRNIEILVPAKLDLICLKARAYLHRGEIDKKDYEDLKRLKPSAQDLAVAIKFIRETSTPPEPETFPDFEVVIKEIEGVAS